MRTTVTKPWSSSSNQGLFSLLKMRCHFMGCTSWFEGAFSHWVMTTHLGTELANQNQRKWCILSLILFKILIVSIHPSCTHVQLSLSHALQISSCFAVFCLLCRGWGQGYFDDWMRKLTIWFWNYETKCILICFSNVNVIYFPLF